MLTLVKSAMEIKLHGEDTSAAKQILDFYKYDEKLANARVIDGMTVQSFLYRI